MGNSHRSIGDLTSLSACPGVSSKGVKVLAFEYIWIRLVVRSMSVLAAHLLPRVQASFE